MITKRAGFKPRAINVQSPYVHRETFDYTYQFRPFNLYIITDDSGKFAITGEGDTNSVFMSTADKKNKLQWVLVDSDTGCIAFFTDTRSYMNIDLVDGVTKVKRSDMLKEGLFKFNQDRTITMMNNVKYQLAFKIPGADKKDAPAKEGFGGLLWRRFKEGFDPATQPVLESVHVDTIKKNPELYSNTWKFELVMDLRDATNNLDTIVELKSMNTNSDSRVANLQQMLANEKELADTEIKYRDAKLAGYEQHWFIKNFL